MRKKIHLINRYLIISLSVLLVFTFFMPWFKFIVGITANEIVFSTIGDLVNHKFRFILLVFPIIGIWISYIFLTKMEKKIKITKLLFVIPFITLSFVLILFYSLTFNSQESNFGNIIEFLGIGFWLSLIISILLPITATTVYSNFKSYFGLLIVMFTITMLILYLLIYHLSIILLFATNIIGIVILILIVITIIWVIGRYIKLILSN